MGKVKKNKPIFYKSKSQVPKSTDIIDAYQRSVEEYYYILNPQIKKGSVENIKKIVGEMNIGDIWIYYPWKNKVVHTVNEDVYYSLRTARNKNVINEQEQLRFRNIRLGIVGLSVGSNALSFLVSTGGPKYIRIADYDTIEISNLNRIKATLLDVGENKAIVAARNTWELDPFAQIDIWEMGVTLESLKKFILQDKLDVFVDTMDNLYLKIQARLLCRKHKIPVLMITENGDSTILDIERFDIEPTRPLFHGIINENELLNFQNFTQKEWLKLAVRIVDPSLLTEKMQDSILSLGVEIAGVPQIATSVNIGGSALAFVTRRIANKYDMPSGRYVVSLENQCIPNYTMPEEVKRREIKTETFKRNFSI